MSVKEAAAIIHLGGGLLRALKRPTRKLSRTRRAKGRLARIGRAALMTLPYLVLHHGEFA